MEFTASKLREQPGVPTYRQSLCNFNGEFSRGTCEKPLTRSGIQQIAYGKREGLAQHDHLTQTKRRTMDRKTLTGAVLAAAVGAMFLTSPVFAQDSSSGASQATVKCAGANSRKAQSPCKSRNPHSKRLNSCK